MKVKFFLSIILLVSLSPQSQAQWLLTGNASTTTTDYLGTSDNNPFRIKTNDITRMVFDVNGNVIVAGNLTSPGTGAGSEKFGDGATVSTYNYSFAAGYLATISGNEAVAIGSQTRAATYGTAIGSSASALGFASTMIGSGASDGGFSYRTAVGAQVLNPGYFSGGSYLNGGVVNIGYNNQADGNINTQFIGANLTANSSNQMLIGNGMAGGFTLDMVLGGGLANPIASVYGPLKIRTTDGTGDNSAGMSLHFKGGKSTGTANGGNIAFYTTAPGTAGASINTETERMRITAAGNIGIGTDVPNVNAKLDVIGNIFSSGKIAIGTNDINKIGTYSLAVNGDAIFNKVKVQLYGVWADYVFNSDYKLQPLQEVELFIKKNKHLPGVPSAATIEKEGIDIGDNQAILLKKIEELTLYVIELDKKIQVLSAENIEMKKNK